MNAELIDFTGKGRADERWHAAHLLLFTKHTRLQMCPEALEDIAALSEDDKIGLLTAMAATVPSSWEFVNVTFLISGVTRAAAQQITRTRTASYAMQSLRVVDARDCGITNPFVEGTSTRELFEDAATHVMACYDEFMSLGAKTEDARAILPLNVQTNMVAQYNLRAFVDLVCSRSSLRTQSEYAELARMMREATLQAWPWAAPFFASRMDSAIKLLESAAMEIGITTGGGVGWKIAKAIDLIRKEV